MIRPPRRPRRAPIVVSSPYRCRDHHDEPVDARGHGCRRCSPQHHHHRATTPHPPAGAR